MSDQREIWTCESMAFFREERGWDRLGSEMLELVVSIANEASATVKSMTVSPETRPAFLLDTGSRRAL